ncbi:hypothetical protein QTP70_028451 [Hemibagrus guttatus]|uniref:Uncharacterized protein n=1 Tax=Hemibagrus guttatus TaxID=175788 RepID=A0AAE0UIS5_9TELE|nr:hypothetical protein QTP70_028451 [Hemibagrus guttatus]
MRHQEEAQRKTQDTLERLYLSAGLGTLQGPSGRAEGSVWVEGGEDSFELHSVDLELEAVEKQIRDLQVKQAQLRQRKAVLESSRTDAHLSQAQRKDAARPGFVHSGAGVPRSLDAAAAEDASQAPGEDLSPSPPPVFEIPTQNRFAPLRETACDAVIIGDSIVRHVRATAAKGKVHTRCLPGARVLNVSAQVPAILKKNIGAVAPPCWHERHQAEADGDPEEGLQEPGGAGTHHIVHDEDHRVRTTSHIPARNREVQ